MSSKHPKLHRPTNVDLVRNPGIGSSKGVTMAQASLDDLANIEGENTFEGDVENDTNAQGGIDKAEVMDRRRAPPREDHDRARRQQQLQGRKTHEQQLRILERNPDGPDPQHLDRETAFAATVSGKPAVGSPIKGKGDGSGAMTDLRRTCLGRTACCRIATRRRVRANAGRIAGGTKPSSARITSRTRGVDSRVGPV